MESPASPIERFWQEPHRHERIAFMMQQTNPESPVTSSAAYSPYSKRKSESPLRDIVHQRDGGTSGLGKSPSPVFYPQLEVDADAADDDNVPDLETIQISARIK